MLQQLDTTTRPANECLDADPATEICTGPGVGAGACYGDSGGPEVFRLGHGIYSLVGVASALGGRETVCATAPSIYISATAYIDWIRSIVPV
jgi:secreted trypsin-like serine protease